MNTNDVTSLDPAAAAAQRERLIFTLQSSVYLGAVKASVELVLDYCDLQGLDPFQKPVHIVPQKVKSGTKPNGEAIYTTRDVLMPSIGLYRVQAARTGEHIGTSEPQFGPTATLEYEETYWDDERKKKRPAKLAYPEWCKVIVRRLVKGVSAEFHATEYWLENYATAAKGVIAPNAMWGKRGHGQLAKCTEAQALRRAFPELGAAPTAEEMEGKPLELDELPTAAPAASSNEFMPASKPAPQFADPLTEAMTPVIWPESSTEQPPVEGEHIPASAPPEAPAHSVKLANDSMKRMVTSAMKRTGKDDAAMKTKFGFELAGLPFHQTNDVLAWARAT